MRSIIPLRIVAICSNVAFIFYGALGGIYPVLILHCLLLPLNIWRISQSFRIRLKKKTAAASVNLHDSFSPYMKIEHRQDGDFLPRPKDPCDRRLLILKSEVLLEESGITLGSGVMFSETALLFTANGKNHTAQCVGMTEYGWLTQDDVAQFCLQNPEIIFHIMGYVTNRFIRALDTLKIYIINRCITDVNS